MKKPKKIIEIEEKVFDTSITVFCNSTLDEVLEWFKKNTVKELHEEITRADLELKTGNACYFKNTKFDNNFIWLKDFYPSPVAMEQLTHECFHLTHHHLDFKGIKLSKDTDEVFAYFLGFIVGEILEQYFN